MRCYGYDGTGRQVIEHEAAILREAAERVLGGEVVNRVVMDFRARGISTSQGRQWSGPTLSRLLRNPRIAGLKAQGDKLVPADWPAIITPRQHEQLVALLDEPSRRSTPATNQRKHLLTGFLTCGYLVEDEDGIHACGKRLYSQHSVSSSLGYVCRSGSPSWGCGRIRISGAALEEIVVAKALARLGSAKVRNRLRKALGDVGEGINLDEGLSALDQRLKEAGELYAQQKLSINTLKAIDATVQLEKAALKERAAQAERLRTLPEEATSPEKLAEWWVDAPLERRRELLALVLDHIEVRPAPRRGNVALDEERLEYHWK